MKFNLEASNVFLSTSSVDPGDLVCSLIPISQMGKERLRKFKKHAPNNHSAHLFYVFANSPDVFHSIHTHLVLNQGQLTRTNGPEVPLLALCRPGLEETSFVLARKAERLRAEWLSSFNPSTSSFCLTLLAGLHPE